MGRANKRVLIVEDNDHWRKVLGLIVERSGYGVIQATNGVEAVAMATAEIPDLIFMDLGLPQMGGDEATAVLKRTPATRAIPIVIQTAYVCTGKPLITQAAEVLQKPIDIADIHRVLAQYLSDPPPAQTWPGHQPA